MRHKKLMQPASEYEIISFPIVPEETNILELMREKKREGLVYLRTEKTEILFKKYVHK